MAAWDVYPVSWSNKMRIPPLISGWWRRLPVIFIESCDQANFENPSKYGFVLRARDLYKPIPTVDVAVSQDIQNLSAFAKEHGITYADLKRFNPWLRDRKLVTGGKTYKLSIPQGKDMYYKTPNTEVYDSAWVVSEN